MSTAYWFRGTLVFAGTSAIEAARRELDAEGYAGHADNALDPASLTWAGDTLTIEQRGWMPHLCVDISTGALATWARHASSGEVIVLLEEDGHGERLFAGEVESVEIEPDDVDVLVGAWKREVDAP
jgi:hypothetical protein